MKRGSFWFSLCVSVIFSFGIASAQDMADNDGNGIPDVYDKVLSEVAGCTIPGFEAAPKGVAIEAAAVAAAVELSPSPLRALDDVNVMPGRQAWIGEGIVVWGNVNSDDLGLTYEWDFGDASPIAIGAVADPHYIAESHAYASVGSYVATLTVKDSLNNVLDSASADVIAMVPALLTDEERLEIDVNQTIQDGLRWLYLDQNLPTGYWEWGDWGTDRPAVTGEAILAFENHGYLPTDDVNVAIYAEYVELGLNYIVSQVQTEAVVAGEPDVNGNGDRAYWTGLSQIRDPLMTGMAMTALVGSGDEASYMTIVEDAVDYLAWAQANDGGWGYGHGSAFNSDNSNAQWPVLGLVGAEIWGIPVPSSVRTNLDSWISAIQNASGASAYQVGGGDNMGMTGALLVEQAFYGDTPGVTRVDDAVDFIDVNWDWTSTGAWDTNHPVNRGANFANYYAMYSIMKGLRLLEVDVLPSGLDWYGDLTRGYAQWLVAEQRAAGWWPRATWTGWDPNTPSPLTTSWALLILAPTVIGLQDIDVVLDIKPSSCPNPFNPKSKGVVPFAIVGTMDFDVTQVDPMSIILTGPSGVLKAVDEPSYKWEIKDSTEPPPEPDPEEDECYQCFEEYPNMDTDGDGIPDIYVGDGYDDFVFYFDNGAVETILDLDNHNDGDCISVTLMALSTDGIPLVNGEDRFLIRLKGGGPEEQSAPVALETAGVYPQPSNPEVWIPYKLNKGFEVSIIIFDSSGRTVRSLELGYREPGAYMSKEKAAYWDGKNEAGEHVSSGIYFCTIKAGDHTATRKIVMMK